MKRREFLKAAAVPLAVASSVTAPAVTAETVSNEGQKRIIAKYHAEQRRVLAEKLLRIKRQTLPENILAEIPSHHKNIPEILEMKLAVETDYADKPVTLQISWRAEDSVSAEILKPGNGIMRFDGEKVIREAYDAKYASAGLVFVHYRTQETECGIGVCCNNFVELRIGIASLIRYGSCWCEFETWDVTAYQRAFAHFARHNEYECEKMAFVCISAGTRNEPGIGNVGIYLDGDGNEVSFADRMGFIKES